MPIDRYTRTSPDYFEPHESMELARYMDITKFLSLLKDRQLFFCRLDKLEDRFEGTLPKISKKQLADWFRNVGVTVDPNDIGSIDEKVELEVERHYEFSKKYKSLTCINCWNEYKGESYALWKVYSDLNQGIMIKSSFSKIINAVRLSEEEIYCSRIKYIDYEKDSIDIGNMMTPLVHKHKAYSYEQEVRLIHNVSNEGWKHDWVNEKYENGIKINVDVQELISEIVISPFAPDWFIELIEDILNKYSIECKLINSTLK